MSGITQPIVVKPAPESMPSTVSDRLRATNWKGKTKKSYTLEPGKPGFKSGSGLFAVGFPGYALVSTSQVK